VVALVALAMAVGTIGTLVPVLPGLALVWAAGLVYGLAEGFGTIGSAAMVLMTALAVAGVAAGWLLPKRAAAAAGAHRRSVWLGVVGAVVGFFVVPVVGVAVGGLLGLYAGEWQRTRDPALAWNATRRTLVAFGLATLAQFAAALAMIATWLTWLTLG
jgi:uncharacterized protein YqgC (DUF456 family)